LRILLLDASWNQTAYLVAELASLGADVTLASPAAPYARGLGRYCRQLESPDVESPKYPDFLDAVLAQSTPDVILPTCEPLQQLLWGRLVASPELPVFPRATPLQQGLLADRQKLYSFARDLAVPIPRSMELHSQDSLSLLESKFGFPCVLRGTQGMSGEQVRVVKDMMAAEAAYHELRRTSSGTPFAQEFLEGARCLVGGLFQQGRALAWFSQMTLECCPAPTGPSVRIRSLADPDLLAHGERLFSELAWDGLACAELIKLHSGGYKFLEINPRPWAAIRAADECGVPLLRMFAEYLTGHPVRARPGFRDGVECTLFPAFLTARIRSNAFPRWSDRRAYLQLARAAPWSKPGLVLQFLRNIHWTQDAMRRRGQPASTAL
jgi:hypothetical protein